MVCYVIEERGGIEVVRGGEREKGYQHKPTRQCGMESKERSPTHRDTLKSDPHLLTCLLLHPDVGGGIRAVARLDNDEFRGGEVEYILY
jgi:hypothetical protein